MAKTLQQEWYKIRSLSTLKQGVGMGGISVENKTMVPAVAAVY